MASDILSGITFLNLKLAMAAACGWTSIWEHFKFKFTVTFSVTAPFFLNSPHSKMGSLHQNSAQIRSPVHSEQNFHVLLHKNKLSDKHALFWCSHRQSVLHSWSVQQTFKHADMQLSTSGKQQTPIVWPSFASEKSCCSFPKIG